MPEMYKKSTSCDRIVGGKRCCPHCSGNAIRYGKNGSGTQRFKCKDCQKCFLDDYMYNACGSRTNVLISEHLKEGCGIRSISRLLRISATTVLKRIKLISRSVVRPCIFAGKEYELDEICTYIKRKTNFIWIAYAIRRDTKEVVDFVVGRRNMQTLGSVTEFLVLAEAKSIYTDKLPLYKALLPPGIHHVRRYGTNRIERKYLSIRTHLKRLGRRTICFSKSFAMLNACLAIYFWG